MSTTTSFLTAHNHSTVSIRSNNIEKFNCGNLYSCRISRREKEVLYLIAHEYSTKEVAQKLFLSTETITSHRQNLMRKLGVKNTAGMVRAAFEQGILKL